MKMLRRWPNHIPKMYVWVHSVPVLYLQYLCNNCKHICTSLDKRLQSGLAVEKFYWKWTRNLLIWLELRSRFGLYEEQTYSYSTWLCIPRYSERLHALAKCVCLRTVYQSRNHALNWIPTCEPHIQLNPSLRTTHWTKSKPEKLTF